MPAAAGIGRLAGERAVAMAGAGKPPTGAYPVLFDERVASGLIGHLVQAINGSAVARGASWLKDALGERVLPAGLDLIEDPLRPRISGSRPFDGEGLPVVRRALVADGVLTRLDARPRHRATARDAEHRQRDARHLRAASPGRRQPRADPGRAEPRGLIAEMGTGLLVTSLIGASINPTTGDYSRGAGGFWVENGAIVRPVNECTIAGNLREMLRTSARPTTRAPTSSRVVPSLLVEGLVIAGS